MDDRLDSDAAGRVIRRALQIEEAAGSAPATHDAGVSPEALVAAAGEVGIDPDAVRDALVLERIERSEAASQRLDRLVGPAEVIVRRSVERSADDALDAVEEWLATAYQMRCTPIAPGTIECRPRGGLATTMRRAALSITGDGNIHPIDRITVASHALQVGASADHHRSIVSVSAHRRTTRARHLGGGVAAGIGGAAIGFADIWTLWPLVSVPMIVGGALIVRAGGSHAARVELELTQMLSAVNRSERPSGLVGRAARRARAALRAVRPASQ